MHPEAFNFLNKSLSSSRIRYGDGINVLEFGSRDVNGSPRQLFTSNVTYVGVDIEDGPGVDIEADAADVEVHDPAHPDTLDNFDVVICMEVAEHTPRWKDIIVNAQRHMKKGGLFIFTAACDPRLPHSAVDGHNMTPNEYTNNPEECDASHGNPEFYQNIDPEELAMLLAHGFSQSWVETDPRGDVYGKAIK